MGKGVEGEKCYVCWFFVMRCFVFCALFASTFGFKSTIAGRLHYPMNETKHNKKTES